MKYKPELTLKDKTAGELVAHRGETEECTQLPHCPKNADNHVALWERGVIMQQTRKYPLGVYEKRKECQKNAAADTRTRREVVISKTTSKNVSIVQ